MEEREGSKSLCRSQYICSAFPHPGTVFSGLFYNLQQLSAPFQVLGYVSTGYWASMGTLHVTLSEMQFKMCGKAEQMPSGACPSGKDYFAIASGSATELVPTYGLLFILGAFTAEIAIIYYVVALRDGFRSSRSQCHFSVMYVPPHEQSQAARVVRPPFVSEGLQRAITISKMEMTERSNVLSELTSRG